MYHTGRRAKCHAGASRLQRRVRALRVEDLELLGAAPAELKHTSLVFAQPA